MSTSEENLIVKSSPRELFLQLFVFITLYVSVFSLAALLFDYINVLFPEGTMYLPSLLDNIRYYSALLLVMFPVYCAVSFLVTKEDKQNPLKKQIKSRRFLVALTLFLAGLISISSVACVLYYFLQGEAGIRILLKAFTIILIGALVFYYYYWDLKQNWKPFQLYIASSVSIIFVVVSIGYGFTLTGSPWKAKAQKEDNAKIEVLKNLQQKIMQSWNEKKQFPDSLAELGIREGEKIDLTLPGATQALAAKMPLDVHGNSVYKKTGKLSFQLCATFKYPLSYSDQNQYVTNLMSVIGGGGSPVSSVSGEYVPMIDGFEYNAKNDNWDHAGGAVCFSRQFAVKVPKKIPKGG